MQTLLGGGGVDEAVHKAAGFKLRLECKKIPCYPNTQARCMTGEARITSGCDLKCKHVIHTGTCCCYLLLFFY